MPDDILDRAITSHPQFADLVATLAVHGSGDDIATRMRAAVAEATAILRAHGLNAHASPAQRH